MTEQQYKKSVDVVVRPLKDSVSAPLSVTRKVRYACLILVNLYIVAHVVLWYAFDIRPWGKTAMTGVPALIRGNINPAALMVIVIITSVFIFGRAFCGWACHIRGILEFSDWVMRKLEVKGYMQLRRRNILLTTRYAWHLRMSAFAILLMPVAIYLKKHPFDLIFDMHSPPPWTDLPGNNGLLFAAQAPINMKMSYGIPDLLFLTILTIVIIFTATFFLNFFFGQGAFCRILCPYAFMLTIFSNINPFQRKITRVGQCTGCRRCTTSCPQGIDVSREIHHYNGKVRSRECIKCFTCVDVCEHNVLKDSSYSAVPQLKSRIEYDRYPWHNEFQHVQTIEPIGPIVDFVSVILSIIFGVAASRFGGFWFFVGTILGFVAIRLVIRFVCQFIRGRSLIPQEK